MTLKEFYKNIKTELCQDYLVRIKMKYDFDKEYEEHNELYLFVGGENEYEWLYDWGEGQPEVEVLGYVAVCDVEVTTEHNRTLESLGESFADGYEDGLEET